MKLELRGRLLSNNELLRLHWTKRRKQIETWAWIVKHELNRTKQEYIGNTSKFHCPVKVKLTVIRPGGGRRMDDANLLSGADKLIIDNLVTQRILVDDSREVLTWEKPIQKVGRPERVIVEIKEAE